MADTIQSMTLYVADGGRRVWLSIEPPLDFSAGKIDLTLDEQSPAFQALSQAWSKSLTQTVAYVVCSPVILNYDPCSPIK